MKLVNSVLISGVLDQLFQHYKEDIRRFVSSGGHARVLLIHPEIVCQTLPTSWAGRCAEWESYWVTNCNEARVAVDAILDVKLDELPGFKLRFMRELPPYLGILAADDADLSEAGPGSFVRVQPIAMSKFIGRGIVMTFQKLHKVEDSPFEYYSQDLTSQWEVAVEDQEYLARRRSALMVSAATAGDHGPDGAAPTPGRW